MNVNDHFNDFPIDYFKIQPEDFIDIIGLKAENVNTHLERSLQNYTLETLELDDNGFIGESLNEKFNFNSKDTTVINCAVGQGKTTAILRQLKREYDNNPNSYFIIAVPLVSLINQYEKDLLDLGINPDDIFNYSVIGRQFLERSIYKSDSYPYSKILKRVHLVTVNTLLGNAGKDAIMQSDAKFEYIQTLTNNLKQPNKDVYITFDEIHEAISNFSKVGILHLFFWQDIVKKIIVLSATYNIASISVIKYFSLLTDNKIKILDSERIVKRAQSKLFLHYDNSDYFNNLSTLREVVEDTINSNRTLDIICYSRTLSDKIVSRESTIGSLLYEKYGEVKLCVSKKIEDIDSDDEEPMNRYDNSFCNVGTNFKSGVSIDKPNHTLIIILPPKSSRRTYKSNNGIFTEGINSVIQALARQRTVGKIHIILPNPIEMDYSSLRGMSEIQRERFEEAYNRIAIPVTAIRNRNNVSTPLNTIISFSEHKQLINESYEKLAQRLLIPILDANRFNLDFPDKVEYTLEKAEKILTQNGFLGRDLACYVTYAAFTNQFYNARLARIYSTEGFNIDEIDPVLTRVYDEYMSNTQNSEKSISQKYSEIRNLLLNRTNNLFDSNQKRYIKEKIFTKLISETELEHLKSESFKYLVSEYNGFQNYIDEESEELVNKLKGYIDRFNNSLLLHEETIYIKKYTDNQIFERDKAEILRIIKIIRERNPALVLSKAKFFRGINETNAGEKMYKYLSENLYISLRTRPIINNIKKDFKKIIETINYQNL
ncbi:DEAD/DEAH box helicase family protein [Chryseobacterium sp. Y16C]|uniref:DEAD/DEAH box helicase family protein n=1 Tax=Chryseobacterium sp. Y16C TaxID=2920939 RepID=UPI001F0B0F34|nr:DEAD/DEAH box helicase family protein [Chryseobacterium sp. Y16C]UMQ40598.1 DEAD/DEAH box helicase family protein [Chryseobacterium sp. Y16C]